jgi:hypothetical protein
MTPDCGALRLVEAGRYFKETRSDGKELEYYSPRHGLLIG